MAGFFINLGPVGFAHKNVFTFLRGPNKPRDDKKGRDDKGVILLKTTPYFCFLKILLLTFLKIRNPVKQKKLYLVGIFCLCNFCVFSRILL